MSKIDRRTFLKQARAILCLAGGSMLLPPRIWADKVKPDIAVVNGEIEQAVKKAVQILGGMARFVKPGSRVVIKPNMSFDTGPERASNTHPLVVKTLAQMCMDSGAERVLVLDNPLRPAERCIENSGIGEACESVKRGIVRTFTDSSRFEEVKIRNGKTLKKTEVMKEVLNSDVLIAAPVAKTHSGAGVSLSMKGMMGLIYNRGIMHRLDLHESIVDLASLLTPQLTLIDASRVLSSGGPGGPGKVLTPGNIIASTDMVAADAYTVSAFQWYGGRYDPDQIKHIRLAHRRKIGRMDIENLNINKTSV
ncbi:MAG: DUF362 domain-containing protein [Desulfobacteraceae bacterium]|nr:DUF362 domain-containing protein [Desulfobacteraceae bacterium]